MWTETIFLNVLDIEWGPAWLLSLLLLLLSPLGEVFECLGVGRYLTGEPDWYSSVNSFTWVTF